MSTRASDSVANIRFGPIVDDHGTIEFDYAGTVVRIKEPADVLLVGGGDAAAKWIAERYGYLLAMAS